MRVIRWLRTAWEWVFGRWRYDLKVVDLEGDELPKAIGRRELIRLIDEGEEWSAGMQRRQTACIHLQVPAWLYPWQ